jgi:hypothetical protein
MLNKNNRPPFGGRYIWWRWRELHSRPPTARRNRYRLSPGFVSPALNPGQQGTGQLRVVLSCRGTKRDPGSSIPCLTLTGPYGRPFRERGTLKRAPRPARWSWLLFFRPCFTWPGQPWPADPAERVNVEPGSPPHCLYYSTPPRAATRPCRRSSLQGAPALAII